MSFLLPCASPSPYLEDTLGSICRQAYEDWILVLVLDGSAPRERELVYDLLPSKKISLIQNDQRLGIAKSLNRGLYASDTEFIARLDADDLCHRDRLTVQTDYMRAHIDTQVVGASATRIGEQGQPLGRIPVKVGDDVRKALLVRNQIVHSAAMFRAESVRKVGGYNASCHLREDYELWLRLALMGEVANVSAELIQYRINATQISRGKITRSARRAVATARLDLAEALGVPLLAARGLQVAWSARQFRPATAKFGAKG